MSRTASDGNPFKLSRQLTSLDEDDLEKAETARIVVVAPPPPPPSLFRQLTSLTDEDVSDTNTEENGNNDDAKKNRVSPAPKLARAQTDDDEDDGNRAASVALEQRIPGTKSEALNGTHGDGPASRQLPPKRTMMRQHSLAASIGGGGEEDDAGGAEATAAAWDASRPAFSDESNDVSEAEEKDDDVVGEKVSAGVREEKKAEEDRDTSLRRTESFTDDQPSQGVSWRVL